MKATLTGTGIAARLVLALAVLAAATTVAAQSVSERDEGLLVQRVLPDSPAATAGILRGDILIAIDGVAVDGPAALRGILADKKAGQEMKLTLLRGEAKVEKVLKIEDRLFRPTLGLEFAPQAGPAMIEPRAGRAFVEPAQPILPREDPERVLRFVAPGGMGQAALVVEVVDGSPADEAGIAVGDRIEAVDGKALENGDLASAIAARKPGDTVALTLVSARKAKERKVEVVLGENPDKKGASYLGLRYSPGFPDLPALRDQLKKTEKPAKPKDATPPDANSGATQGNRDGGVSGATGPAA